MKIVVDMQRCEGHGMCEGAAPEVFELDESGNLIVKYEGREIPSELWSGAEEAVRLCPVAALKIARS